MLDKNIDVELLYQINIDKYCLNILLIKYTFFTRNFFSNQMIITWKEDIEHQDNKCFG
jgi:hypothetical protein